MNSDPYVYPGTQTLINKFGITDHDILESIERQFTTQRAREGLPPGSFDLAHLQAIHKHLFQDLYPWAGEIRTIEISKNGNQFLFRRYIQSGMTDIHQRLVKSNFLTGLELNTFAQKASVVLGDVNFVHPFREGNGRTQMYYLQQLANNAGHSLDLRKITSTEWMNASKNAHVGDYSGLEQCIRKALI